MPRGGESWERYVSDLSAKGGCVPSVRQSVVFACIAANDQGLNRVQLSNRIENLDEQADALVETLHRVRPSLSSRYPARDLKECICRFIRRLECCSHLEKIDATAAQHIDNHPAAEIACQTEASAFEQVA